MRVHTSFSVGMWMIRNLKIIFVVFIFLNLYPCETNIFASNTDSQTRKYIRNSNELNIKKRKVKNYTNESRGRKIKSLIYITFIPGTFKKFSFNFRPINNL